MPSTVPDFIRSPPRMLRRKRKKMFLFQLHLMHLLPFTLHPPLIIWCNDSNSGRPGLILMWLPRSSSTLRISSASMTMLLSSNSSTTRTWPGIKDQMQSKPTQDRVRIVFYGRIVHKKIEVLCLLQEEAKGVRVLCLLLEKAKGVQRLKPIGNKAGEKIQLHLSLVVMEENKDEGLSSSPSGDENSALNKWLWQLRDSIDEATDVLNEKQIKLCSTVSSKKKRLEKIGKRALQINPNVKGLEDVVKKLDKISVDVANVFEKFEKVEKGLKKYGEAMKWRSFVLIYTSESQRFAKRGGGELNAEASSSFTTTILVTQAEKPLQDSLSPSPVWRNTKRYVTLLVTAADLLLFLHPGDGRLP
ncbi:hypothetical protein IEQ34_019089 [Dendrobium chrysotoxum]|uniref:Uncharacterized protein n=1 Tax=Dendrobium chrysotoxum TaxID=161865 RepID=A0AAV7G7M5_DENCH|nr:hypothetical protein IEQ34_019089 [Dendrobium chrysotoxum]